MAEEDIIFGKNRHFFGGIEPSNMLKFTASYKNGMGVIEAELPKDTVIDGQTLCTVKGAVIRKSTTGYPVDEFDGELFADIKSSTILADTDLDPDMGYYYAAFPYTGQGVYNRGYNNRATINVPDVVTAFSAKTTYEYSTETYSVELSVELPPDVAGVVIRKSTAGYPVNETDGDECVTLTYSGTHIDSAVTKGVTYYYSAFTYTELGRYNRDISKSVSVLCAGYNYLFGYDIDLSDEDPFTRVSYPSDVDNSGYTPAFMDYNEGIFNYGDWPNMPGKYFMPKPCMLTYDGNVAHYLDPDDYTKQEGSTRASSIADFTFNGNAMMEWPKIYTYREIVNGVYKFRCSDIPQDTGWDCWCNYDGNDNVIDHFYTSIYIGSYEDVSSGMDLRSMSGRTILSNEKFTTFRSRAMCTTNSGDARYLTWDIGLLADYLLIRDLLVMMGRSTDCQTVYGNGRGNENTPLTNTGILNDKGMFWGSDTWTEGVKVFGMENWWGNYSQHIAGWNSYASGTNYVKLTKGSHDGFKHTNNSASNRRTIFGPENTSYQKRLNYSAPVTPSGTNGGYISEMFIAAINEGYSDVSAFGLFPKTMSGSSSTYECDTFKWSTASSTHCSYAVGGNCNGSVGNGPFSAVAVPTIELPSYTGAFLSYKPLV